MTRARARRAQNVTPDEISKLIQEFAVPLPKEGEESPTSTDETAAPAPEVSFIEFLKMMKTVEERGMMGDAAAFFGSLF